MGENATSALILDEKSAEKSNPPPLGVCFGPDEPGPFFDIGAHRVILRTSVVLKAVSRTIPRTFTSSAGA